jgi:hypothetical protein
MNRNPPIFVRLERIFTRRIFRKNEMINLAEGAV